MTRKVTKDGSGPTPQKGQVVTVHCTGLVVGANNSLTVTTLLRAQAACSPTLTHTQTQTRNSGRQKTRARKCSHSASAKGRSSAAGCPFDRAHTCVMFGSSHGLDNGGGMKDDGVLQMKLGEHASLTCSPDFGYGAGGFPAWGIPPNAILQFGMAKEQEYSCVLLLTPSTCQTSSC